MVVTTINPTYNFGYKIDSILHVKWNSYIPLHFFKKLVQLDVNQLLSDLIQLEMSKFVLHIQKNTKKYKYKKTEIDVF